MKKLSTWLLVLFIIMFWAFRILVTVMYQLKQDFGGIEPLNETVEIILLFVVLACIVLIVKRKMIGSLAFFLTYGLYFGADLFTKFNIMMASDSMSPTMYLNMMISLIGVILPVAALLDLLMDKNRKDNPKDKKTDWFYKNEQFDRQYDERADKNNYRTL